MALPEALKGRFRKGPAGSQNLPSWVLWAACLFLFSQLTSPALAATHYVSKTGSRTYPYDTWATAADTVARAVEAAGEWDTILIAAGHFVSDSVRMKRGQVLRGAGPDLTVLDTFPAGPVRPIIAEDSCVVRDFRMEFLVASGVAGAASAAVVFPAISVGRDRALTVKNVKFYGIASCVGASFQDVSGTGRVCVVDSCECVDVHSAIEGLFARFEIRNCVFRWDRDANVGVIIADYSQLLVENCRFYGYDPVVVTANAAAISTARTESIVIRNNLFYSTMGGEALDLNCRDGSSVPMLLGLIENNTIVGFRNHFLSTRSGWLFLNNISTRDRSTGSTQPFYEGYVTGAYNLTWDNSPADSGVVRGHDTIPNDVGGNHDNRNLFPMFVDTIDFLLQAYSPAIDAGDPGILDPDGSRSDIGYTGGPGGITYPYVDLPPAIPRSLKGRASDSQIVLSWRGNHEADLARYELFRDSLPVVAVDSGLLVASVFPDSGYADRAVVAGRSYYYRLRAVDAQGNASGLSSEVQVVAAGLADPPATLPETIVLYPNYPNPFNAWTRIDYSLSQPLDIALGVYDALGRQVRTLIEGPQPAGVHSLNWEATGHGSGVYFLVLKSAGGHRVRKALLLK